MLSNRLKVVADFTKKDDYIVDVGCDHALLSIYLVKNNLVLGAIATDINPNALDNAIKNIKYNNLENEIETILSNGLENIDLKRVNTIIITGMGTNTIKEILNTNEKLENIKKIIIQSNNNYYDLRKWVTSLGFFIEDETITYDNKKYYLTVCFKKGFKKYSKKDYYWGLIKPENLEYYEFLNISYMKIYKKIPLKKTMKKLKMFLLIQELNKIIKYCSANKIL